ncbi:MULTISPECIES: DnaA ATPase domain-containing protein [Streptomyces]|uniref:DnaA ATPase domain-containing protein n=1 Tax=Streptomyces TaxID=1883 RepID=UPI00067A82C4|nr:MULTISPECIES: DnaA/Hda family protein [unclassified Streptomyces]NUV65708.1 ATP-binding protein [Streptomyces sp. CAI-121]NUW12445.1 ATP-binding protein [Streptomyces sp. CAI-68]
MHSDSDGPDLRKEWLQQRTNGALSRFHDTTPLIYRKRIDVPKEVTDWVAGWGSSSLFLTGHIGVGKTHTAWETCRLWLKAFYGPERPWNGAANIYTYRSTALFDALRPDGPDEVRRTLIKTLQDADLVFVDDLAAPKVTEWTQERLFEIFDERYIQQRPVIITSDVLPSDLGPVTGPRVASRLGEMCRDSVVWLEGDDRRRGEAA